LAAQTRAIMSRIVGCQSSGSPGIGEDYCPPPRAMYVRTVVASGGAYRLPPTSSGNAGCRCALGFLPAWDGAQVEGRHGLSRGASVALTRQSGRPGGVGSHAEPAAVAPQR
jgi:hypothetical protein